MNKAKITTYQDEYHVIKIHWSDVQDFYDKDDNNNGYVYGIEVNHKDNETECFWFKTEQKRDMEYIKMKTEKPDTPDIDTIEVVNNPEQG